MMSKKRLIKRLEWYYPTERFHTYITFPALLLYSIYACPIWDIVFLIYGLLVCIAILYQGQHYWKLKLYRLRGEPFDQEKNVNFFKKSKLFNIILIGLMPLLFLLQLGLQNWDLQANNMLIWGVVANLMAILEHINYYHTQLMIDNQYDVKYLMKHRRLKKASLAKDLEEGKI